MVHFRHFEIILNLIKNKENFVTNIAKDLNTSHVEILRKTKDLEEKGVLRYSYSGKNKVYTLKDNTIAHNMIIMAEMYKTNMIIDTYPKLGVLCDEIRKTIRSDMIILFGSYAKMTATKDSDIDLYVETQDRTIKQRLKELSRKINVKIGEFDKDTNLVKEIIADHAIITGVEKYYAILKKA